jgi:hypothetical protein
LTVAVASAPKKLTTQQVVITQAGDMPNGVLTIGVPDDRGKTLHEGDLIPLPAKDRRHEFIDARDISVS